MKHPIIICIAILLFPGNVFCAHWSLQPLSNYSFKVSGNKKAQEKFSRVVNNLKSIPVNKKFFYLDFFISRDCSFFHIEKILYMVDQWYEQGSGRHFFGLVMCLLQGEKLFEGNDLYRLCLILHENMLKIKVSSHVRKFLLTTLKKYGGNPENNENLQQFFHGISCFDDEQKVQLWTRLSTIFFTKISEDRGLIPLYTRLVKKLPRIISKEFLVNAIWVLREDSGITVFKKELQKTRPFQFYFTGLPK
ncbi:hypothetical protein ACFL35_02655 [Candidatus Riflebacteria bacterium]